MSLIRRRKSKSPADQVAKVARLALKGLVAQRVARKALKGYKLARKLPLIAGVGAAVAFAVKKARGGGGEPDAGFTPPSQSQSAPTQPAPTAAAPSPTAPAAPPAPPAPADLPSPAAESGADVPDAVANAGEVPADPAAAAEGGSEAGGNAAKT